MLALRNTQAAAVAASVRQRRQPVIVALRLAIALAVALSLVYDLAVLGGLLVENGFSFGLSLLLIGIGIFVAMEELYAAVVSKAAVPRVPLATQLQAQNWTTTTNLAEYLTPDLVDVLLGIERGGQYDYGRFKDAFVRSEAARTILIRAGLVGDLQDDTAAAPALAQPVTALDALLAYAATFAVEAGAPRIGASHVLRAMAEHDQAFANQLFAHHVEPSDLKGAIAWFDRGERLKERHWFWQAGSVGSYGIGRDWSSGYTPTLSRYATDISKYLRDPALASRVVGRDAVIEQVIAALAGEGTAHALLVGVPGIGKKTIVNGVAAKIAAGEVPPTLRDKHVMQLDVNALLSGASGEGELSNRLLRVLNDAARAGNIILFIDNIHALLATNNEAIGSVNAAALLAPVLSGGQLQLIASTTPQDFHTTVAREGAVASAFTRIDVEEPTPEDTATILQMAALHLEYRLGVLITMPVIRTAVTDADRYLHQEPRPENAMNLLEAAAMATANRAEAVVTPATVDAVVSQQSKVPVGEVGGNEKDKLLNLEATLHQKVIGQDEAIAAVAQALRRARSGLATGKRPIGSFLFLGPTGVGKTETARALAAAYFGSQEAMLRFDMSEYQSPAALGQLIGSATDAQAGGAGQLTSQIKDHPFSLLLLDELEKAHPDVLNVFLQVLDDGHVTDGLGQKIDFTNTIIIATSNAGSEFIRQAVTAGQTSEQFQPALLNELQSKGIFRPEFLNRFDSVIAFHPLSPEQLIAIVDLQLADLNDRLKEQGIALSLTQAAKQALATRGYQPEFGARALRRVMQTAVEDVVANRLLAGTIKRGDAVTFDVGDLAA